MQESGGELIHGLGFQSLGFRVRVLRLSGLERTGAETRVGTVSKRLTPVWSILCPTLVLKVPMCINRASGVESGFRGVRAFLVLNWGPVVSGRRS